MFGLGRYLYSLCGRVATAVRGFVIPSEGGEDGDASASSNTCMTPEQKRHEEQRKLANADRFYSNGHLVETVQVDVGESSNSLLEEDIEAQTAKKPHPYQDRNRMTTLMEPVE